MTDEDLSDAINILAGQPASSRVAMCATWDILRQKLIAISAAASSALSELALYKTHTDALQQRIDTLEAAVNALASTLNCGGSADVSKALLNLTDLVGDSHTQKTPAPFPKIGDTIKFEGIATTRGDSRLGTIINTDPPNANIQVQLCDAGLTQWFSWHRHWLIRVIVGLQGGPAHWVVADAVLNQKPGSDKRPGFPRVGDTIKIADDNSLAAGIVVGTTKRGRIVTVSWAAKTKEPEERESLDWDNCVIHAAYVRGHTHTWEIARP